MFAFRDQSIYQLETVGTSIQFGGQTIPPLPNGETLTYARCNASTIAGPSSAGNAWLYRNGLWVKLNSNPVGGWGVVIDDQYVAWQEQNNGVKRQPIAGGQFVFMPNPWQATGLLDMQGGVVRSDDRSQPFTFLWNGGTFHGFLWMTRNGRTVMQANEMPGGAGVVVWDANTSQLWRVSNEDLQWPSRLSADGKTVALTGDLLMGFIPDTLWTLEPTAVPIPPIEPLTRKAIFGAFLSASVDGTVPSWANAYIDEGSGGSKLIGDAGQAWAICDLEQTPGAVIASPACYIGANSSAFTHLHGSPNYQYDLYALEVYRNPGMTDDEFSAYASTALGPMPAPTVIITNSTTRIGANGPTLTPRDVQAAQSLLSRFGYQVLVFEYGRAGEVPETAAQFTVWRNHQPCQAQVLPPTPPNPEPPQPQPPEPEMPYKTFSVPSKAAPDYIAYMNDVGQRVGPYLNVPTNNPAPDTGFTSAGQAVNECYDLWDAAQQKLGNGGATIPSANIMSQITIDRKAKNLSADAVSASLIHEVPLR